jgi:hypothetical protein
MEREWDEVSPTFRSPHNMLLLNDCPFRYIGNMPFLYILPFLFNFEIENNYSINNLWPYLKGLLKAVNTRRYVGSTHMGRCGSH